MVVVWFPGVHSHKCEWLQKQACQSDWSDAMKLPRVSDTFIVQQNNDNKL